MQFIGPNGSPSWCLENDVDPLDMFVIAASNASDTTVAMFEPTHKEMIVPFTFFILISCFYNLIDIALSMAIWSAAVVGTPCEPRGRTKALHTVVWIKITFMNILLMIVLGGGIYMVEHGRRSNYGCGHDSDDKVQHFEVSVILFCFDALLNLAHHSTRSLHLFMFMGYREQHGTKCSAW